MEFITFFWRVPLHFNLNLPLKLQPAAKELKWLQWLQCNRISRSAFADNNWQNGACAWLGSPWLDRGWTGGEWLHLYSDWKTIEAANTEMLTRHAAQVSTAGTLCFDHFGGNIVMNQNELKILKSRHKIFDNSTLCTFVKFGYFRHFETYWRF